MCWQKKNKIDTGDGKLYTKPIVMFVKLESRRDICVGRTDFVCLEVRAREKASPDFVYYMYIHINTPAKHHIHTQKTTLRRRVMLQLRAIIFLYIYDVCVNVCESVSKGHSITGITMGTC